MPLDSPPNLTKVPPKALVHSTLYTLPPAAKRLSTSGMKVSSRVLTHKNAGWVAGGGSQLDDLLRLSGRSQRQARGRSDK